VNGAVPLVIYDDPVFEFFRIKKRLVDPEKINDTGGIRGSDKFAERAQTKTCMENEWKILKLKKFI